MTSINSVCFIFCDYKMIEKIVKNRPCKYTIYIWYQSKLILNLLMIFNCIMVEIHVLSLILNIESLQLFKYNEKNPR